jgi:lipid A 3-O-deacylase PagL
MVGFSMLQKTAFLVVAAALAAVPLFAAPDPALRDFNMFLSGGKSQPNWHGQSTFRSVTFELTARPPHVFERLHLSESRHDAAGIAVTYSDVHQPHSWFGHKYESTDDWVRAETATMFIRHQWRNESGGVKPYLDIGTGPMWSNRRVPAATSRINFDSRFTVGMSIPTRGDRPFMLAYRFSHISNGVFAQHNPGLNVHTLLVGTRVTRIRH